jgi:hypothetical protein
MVRKPKRWRKGRYSPIAKKELKPIHLEIAEPPFINYNLRSDGDILPA